ncbi:unnamed protein product, partial [Polarella glacialis]
ASAFFLAFFLQPVCATPLPQCDGGASPGCAIPKAQALLQTGGVKKTIVQVHGASAEAFAEPRPLAQELVNDKNNSIVVVVVVAGDAASTTAAAAKAATSTTTTMTTTTMTTTTTTTTTKTTTTTTMTTTTTTTTKTTTTTTTMMMTTTTTTTTTTTKTTTTTTTKAQYYKAAGGSLLNQNCPPGQGVESENECKLANVFFGGVFYSIDGTWTPAGCSWFNHNLYWNKHPVGRTRTYSWQGVICKVA